MSSPTPNVPNAPVTPTEFLHIIERARWHEALAAGALEPAPEGFVHLSTAEQLCTTASRYYSDADDLVVLRVPSAPLDDALQWAESHPGEWFPHAHRPIAISEISGVAPFPQPFRVPTIGTVRRADPTTDAAAIPALGDIVDGRRPRTEEIAADRVDRYRMLLQTIGGLGLVYDDGAQLHSAVVAVPARSAFGRGPEVPGRLLLSSAATHPASWGRGLASLLLHHLATEARTSGYDCIELWTQADNVRARALYERHGWERTDAPAAFDACGDPIIQYERSLVLEPT